MTIRSAGAVIEIVSTSEKTVTYRVLLSMPPHQDALHATFGALDWRWIK